MKIIRLVISIAALGAMAQTASADTKANVYIGFGLDSLALDAERVPGVYTRSPGHSSKLGTLILGYQFNSQWAADLSFGTDMSNNVDADKFAVNAYRFIGENSWRPYLSAGLSHFSIDDATEDSTSQIQAGVGLSGALTNNVEMRLGYQHHFGLDDPSYDDDSVMLSFNWHFRKPEAKPAPVAAPLPAPEPQKKQVVDTYELQVQFDFDKSNIKSVYQAQFEEIGQILKDNPGINMTVEGHTCWIGTEEYNQGLSERRADSVKQKFVSDYGIAGDRISTIGFGETRPVADNETLEGRRKNRRAIAVILVPRK